MAPYNSRNATGATKLNTILEDSVVNGAGNLLSIGGHLYHEHGRIGWNCFVVAIDVCKAPRVVRNAQSGELLKDVVDIPTIDTTFDITFVEESKIQCVTCRKRKTLDQLDNPIGARRVGNKIESDISKVFADDY